MPALARLIIALALAVALPVQAMTAMSGGICMMTTSHHDGAHDPAEAPGAAAHSHGVDGPPDRAPCPPCAACCASAAIAAAPVSSPDSAAPDPIPLAPGLPVLAEMPSRLDRPPLPL